jgi:hypothetical protein
MEGVSNKDLTRHVTGLLMHEFVDPSPSPASKKG